MVAAALVVAAFSGILALHVGSSLTRQWISDVALAVMAFLGAVACFERAVRERGRLRTPWVLLGASALSWSCGQVIWTYYECFRGRDVPFPSYADLGYLAAVPLLVAGLLLLSSGPRQAAGVARTVLDGIVVAVALLLVSWEVVLEATMRAGGDTLLARVISLAYPLGDVVCASVAIVIIARTRFRAGLPMVTLLLLAAGSVSSAVADSGFAFLTLKKTYFSGHPIDVGWFVGYMLLALAARRSDQTQEASEAAEHNVPVGVIAPYIPVLLAIGAGGYRELTRQFLGPFMAWGLLALVVLVVWHQILATFENTGLTLNLRARTLTLAEQEQWFRSLVQNSSDVVTVVDPRGVIRYQTPSVKRVFGYEPESLQGQLIDTLVPPGEASRLHDALRHAVAQPGSTTELEVKVRNQYGDWCDTESTITSLVDDPAVRGLVLNTRDTSERKRLEEQLSHQAFHDALTGLANRALFRDRVTHALESRSRDATDLAVLFLDLDGFKAVNDALGHSVGDELLVQAAQRLSASVRPGDTVARLGGDEFAVLLERIERAEEAVHTGQRLRDVLQDPFVLESREVLVRASTGIAVADSGLETADELLRNADLAMYRAKTTGEGGYELYEPSMHSALIRRIELENDLRHALERDQLTIHYQPILDLRTCEIAGVEALVRWHHPERGLVMPLDFIPLAEETGLISDIGAWVLKNACAQGAAWQRSLPEQERSRFKVAVNLSSRQLGSPTLLNVVEAALAETGLTPASLVLEMTESTVMDSTMDTVALLRRLKFLGVRLAIDDFGTGYSALSYLSRFPVDVLKVDRSFVEKVATESHSAELVRTIAQLGRSLSLETVAEGIEEFAQVEALREMGCEFGQGFLFSRPLPAEDITALLSAVEPFGDSTSAPEALPTFAVPSGDPAGRE